MPYRNMTAWRESVIEGPARLAIPIMTHPGIDLVGKTVLDAVTDGEVHFQAVNVLAQRYPSAAATMMMDLSVEAEAFGASVRFARDEVPAVAERRVRDAEGINTLAVPTSAAGRVPQYLAAAQLAAAHIADRPVFAGCIGPFSLAGRLYDMTEIMTDLLVDPESIHALLDKCTQFLLAYARAFKEAGTNGIIIAEPAAGVLSPEDCAAFSSAYVARIVSAVQDDGFMVVLHNCGAREALVPAMASTGAAGFHFGNVIDMVKPLEILPPNSMVMGNVDPVRTMKMAPPEEVRTAVADLLQRTKRFPNYVLSTGCDTPPGVTEANIEAFYATLEMGNRSRVAGSL